MASVDRHRNEPRRHAVDRRRQLCRHHCVRRARRCVHALPLGGPATTARSSSSSDGTARRLPRCRRARDICMRKTARRWSAAGDRSGTSCVRECFSTASAAAKARRSRPSRSRACVPASSSCAPSMTASRVSYTGAWRASGQRRIATLGIGYADGYRRALSNRGAALVRGQRAPIVGIVTMDMVMLDVTGMACEVGDVATLIGRDGDDLLTVDDVARAGELLTLRAAGGSQAPRAAFLPRRRDRRCA